MKLGFCTACGTKIGSRTSNRRLSYDKSKMAQISLIYGYEGRSEKTRVHVVVCKNCAASPVLENIEAGLARDEAFQIWKSSAPHAVLEGCEEDVLNG